MGVGEREPIGPLKRTETVASLGTPVDPSTGVTEDRRKGAEPVPRWAGAGDATAGWGGLWSTQAAVDTATTATPVSAIRRTHALGRDAPFRGRDALACACAAGIFSLATGRIYQPGA